MMPGFANALQLVSTPFTNVMLGPTAYVPGEQTVQPPLESLALPTPQGGPALWKRRRRGQLSAAAPSQRVSPYDRTPRSGAKLVTALCLPETKDNKAHAMHRSKSTDANVSTWSFKTSAGAVTAASWLLYARTCIRCCAQCPAAAAAAARTAALGGAAAARAVAAPPKRPSCRPCRMGGIHPATPRQAAAPGRVVGVW
jgi:hypothetical protein